MFKLIVAGSREFNNYIFIEKTLNHFLSNIVDDIEIVCGEARGPDKHGRIYGEARNYKIKSMPAEWDKYGKRAGYIRNEEMAIYADACIVFWDGKSKGTKHMIDLAIKHKLKLRIVRVFPNY